MINKQKNNITCSNTASEVRGSKSVEPHDNRKRPYDLFESRCYEKYTAGESVELKS